MSDVTKSPVAGASQNISGTEDSKNKWKILLGVFALVSVASLIWAINSIATVSN